MKLEEKIQTIPECPGVYMMKDKYGNIIYIGKSICLKNRVRSYFYSSDHPIHKIKQMISLVSDIEYRVTDTELEALLLECELIKSHSPLYNRLLKNEKKYCYLMVKNGNLSVVYDKIEGHDRYYGPYKSRRLIEEFINFFSSIAPISYSRGEYGFHYQVLPSRVPMSTEEKENHIKNICNIIEDDAVKFMDTLIERMNEHVKSLEFERSKFYRDGIGRIRYVAGIEKLISETKEGKIILSMEMLSANTFKLFCIFGNKLIWKRKISMMSSIDEGLIDELGKAIEKNKFHNNTALNKSLRKESIDGLLIVNAYLHNKQNNVVFLEVHPMDYSLKEDIESLIRLAKKAYEKEM